MSITVRRAVSLSWRYFRDKYAARPLAARGLRGKTNRIFVSIAFSIVCFFDIFGLVVFFLGLRKSNIVLIFSYVACISPAKGLQYSRAVD